MRWAMPSRMTWAAPRTMSRSAEADFWAENSCAVPIAALRTSTNSTNTALGTWPTANDTAAAISRM